ncbi:MAG: OmpA family protein [Bacteroidetes bacterium]|nr:OmpA family protein [Bacteroidota bacterium]
MEIKEPEAPVVVAVTVENTTKAIVKPLPAKVKTEVSKLVPQKKSENAVAGLPLNIPDPDSISVAVPIPFPDSPVSVPVPVPVPVADADGDGVADANDPCPYIKGSAKHNGCPDTDGDGIIDSNDACPLEAGTKETNGCAVKGKLTEEGSPITQHFGNIEFKTSSAEVHGLYKLDIIEPAIDSLFEHDDLILVITGHTDSEGDALFNMNLSQARADAVKAIFIRKGLPEEKIQTVTYGEIMPLKENETEFGRQRNRRVEIHVIQKKNP